MVSNYIWDVKRCRKKKQQQYEPYYEVSRAKLYIDTEKRRHHLDLLSSVRFSRVTLLELCSKCGPLDPVTPTIVDLLKRAGSINSANQHSVQHTSQVGGCHLVVNQVDQTTGQYSRSGHH